VLALAVAALVLAGCGSMGSGGSSQGSSQGSGQGEEASKTAGSSGVTKSEDKGASDDTKPDRERASEDGGRLEHPTLGSARAPVVLTEYSDYQ
jgi:protein-disulfide isomerase